MFKQIRSKQLKLLEPRPEELIRKDHPYRKLLSIINFKEFCKPLESLYRKDFGRPGYHISKADLQLWYYNGWKIYPIEN
jgi:hypothetical protein